MTRVQKYFVSLFVCTCLLFSATRAELVALEKDAISFGTGPGTIYAFVDPLCPPSQSYIALISDHDKLLQTYTYFVFLHRLQEFDSDSTIDYIYNSHNPKESLLRIMLEDEELQARYPDQDTLDKRQRIDKVAESTGMKRRPYLLIYGAGSSFCKVSEGTAPCMKQESKK